MAMRYSKLSTWPFIHRRVRGVSYPGGRGMEGGREEGLVVEVVGGGGGGGEVEGGREGGVGRTRSQIMSVT